MYSSDIFRYRGLGLRKISNLYGIVDVHNIWNNDFQVECNNNELNTMTMVSVVKY
jgi:hypothetical protein